MVHVLVVGALLLGACGDDDPAAGDSTVASTSSTTSTTTVIAVDTASESTPSTTTPATTAPATTDPPPTDPPTTDPPATDPPPTTEPDGGVDSCLVGTWELQSQRFFDELIAQSPEQFPGSVTHVGGRQVIEFSADGTATGGREQWSFRIDGPEGTVYVTLDAMEEGTYATDGDRMDVAQTTVGDVEVSMEIEQGGSRVPLPAPMGGTFPGEEAAAASGTYTCDETTFTLTSTEGAITLTNVWDRVAG